MRAKFKTTIVKPNANGGFGDVYVELHPVISDSSENKRFWEMTPMGTLTMTITNPEAKTFFKEGREYYLDFTPASDEAIDATQR